MTAMILSGTEIAKEIREDLTNEIAELKAKHNVVPGLVTILVGEDPASQSYVGAKERTSLALGIYSERKDIPVETTQEELLALVKQYNEDPKIHGILVQLPLPKHIDEKAVLYEIDPDKDVDAFHPFNVGKLMIGEPSFLPCTPAGIQEMIIRSGTKTDGAEVVVVGRSNIVGKPIAMMMVQKAAGANATVTIVHTATKDMAAHTTKADILIVAAGRPKAVTAEMVKEGAVVIDVGVNRIGMSSTGKAILCGDVDFEAIREKASAITPVPGGVGPMTITMLMKNTVRAAKLAHGIS
jgi:methylenetetrahydrofolate dehydrogenase (NADP+)/methenyltetrahydrofolate cyclohydrolase